MPKLRAFPLNATSFTSVESIALTGSSACVVEG